MRHKIGPANVPASLARVHFGELLDDITNASTVVTIEQAKMESVILVLDDEEPGWDPVEWISEVNALRESLAPYLVNFDEWERPEDIIRELRDR